MLWTLLLSNFHTLPLNIDSIIINENHFAYFCQSSTVCALIHLLYWLIVNLIEETYLDAVVGSLNFSKAFNTGSHLKLTRKKTTSIFQKAWYYAFFLPYWQPPMEKINYIYSSTSLRGLLAGPLYLCSTPQISFATLNDIISNMLMIDRLSFGRSLAIFVSNTS